MDKPVLVTGATGFVGSYLVRQLLEANRSVRAVVRAPEKLPYDVRDRVEVIEGDLAAANAREMIHEATDGVGTVLHLAALAVVWAPRLEDFHTVNVEFVRYLLEACTSNEVDRLVHVSTSLTLPPHRASQTNGIERRRSPYEKSKLAGERLVKKYAATGKHAVITHPTRVYGRGPMTDANAVSRVVSLYMKGLFRFRINDANAEANYVHVEDVARGIIQAAENGESGAQYALGGENATFNQFLEVLAEITGRRRKVFTLPAGAALSVAKLGETWGRLGGTPTVTVPWMHSFIEDRRVDMEPCRRDFGYDPRSLREGLPEIVSWLSSGR